MQSLLSLVALGLDLLGELSELSVHFDDRLGVRVGVERVVGEVRVGIFLYTC